MSQKFIHFSVKTTFVITVFCITCKIFIFHFVFWCVVTRKCRHFGFLLASSCCPSRIHTRKTWRQPQWYWLALTFNTNTSEVTLPRKQVFLKCVYVLCCCYFRCSHIHHAHMWMYLFKFSSTYSSSTVLNVIQTMLQWL